MCPGCMSGLWAAASGSLSVCCFPRSCTKCMKQQASKGWLALLLPVCWRARVLLLFSRVLMSWPDESGAEPEESLRLLPDHPLLSSEAWPCSPAYEVVSTASKWFSSSVVWRTTCRL